MDELDKLLAGELPPAVYRLMSRAAVETVAERVEANGWRCFALNGDTINNKSSFLAACASALHFPDYFGRNWDAFEECLNDLSWVTAKGYVVLYDNAENFARNAPEEWDVAFDILGDAVGNWQKNGTPFVVLMRKTGNFVRGLPQV